LSQKTCAIEPVARELVSKDVPQLGDVIQKIAILCIDAIFIMHSNSGHLATELCQPGEDEVVGKLLTL
jgi:hypothetical protein